MNNFEKAGVRDRILLLVRLKSTGTPSDLANKLGISERSVKRIVRELKKEGKVLRYDHNRVSYVGPDD